MKLVSILTSVLLLCCVSPLRAGDAKDAAKDPDHADVTIDPIPKGWEGGLKDANHIFIIMNDDLAIIQINTTRSESESFEAFCKVCMERQAARSTFTDRKATDAKPATVGPKGTLEYDITGKEGDVAKHIHVYMMPIRKTYAFMYCRCTETQWEEYKTVFEEMVKSVK